MILLIQAIRMLEGHVGITSTPYAWEATGSTPTKKLLRRAVMEFKQSDPVQDRFYAFHLESRYSRYQDQHFNATFFW